MTTWQRVGRALLGRWPSQVASWGEEGIAAFIEELQVERISPDQAVEAVRLYQPEGLDFPPSVPTLAKLARREARTRAALSRAESLSASLRELDEPAAPRQLNSGTGA